jgi:hypothetical protein
MKRWTVWLDYFATGEGRAFMALVTYAKTAEDARKCFAARFHDYYAQGARVEEGFVRNEVLEFLFSTPALDMAQNDPSVRDMYASFHFNRS